MGHAEILRAARRYYDHGETLAEIASDLGISGSYLGRLLRMAKENGWVRIYIDADRETELAAEILRKHPHLKHVEVVPSGSTPQDTARALGTVAARWFNELVETDEASGAPAIHNVAIGGGAVHEAMIDQVVRRQNRISVGPTALTPERGKVARFTAPTLAAMLAMRLGALGPGERMPPPDSRQGFRYNLTLDPPAGEGLDALAGWYAQLERRPDFAEMTLFWKRVDVAFVSVVDIDWPYADTKNRLTSVGLSVEEMQRRGALALLANQFVDAAGRRVDLADGVPSYEPAMPPDDLRTLATAERASAHVVLDAWGKAAAGCAEAIVGSGIANVLLCDTLVAEQLL